MIRIILEGNPIPWKAPKRNKNHYFSPNYEAKNNAKNVTQFQYNSELIETAVKIEALFLFSIPASTSKKQSILLLDSPHIKKPDIDNCTKFALDVIKGIVIKDDNQVYELFAQKFYSNIPKTILQIYPYDINVR